MVLPSVRSLSRTLLTLVVVCGALPACSDTDSGLNEAPAAPEPRKLDAASVGQRLGDTLEDLAKIGEKRAGTPAGIAAGEYVMQRFNDAGLSDTRFESFSFLMFSVAASSLSASIDGSPQTLRHDVFAYSGAGRVDAEVVYVGEGHEADYEGLDVSGRVVLVDRDATFHRSAQYRVMVQRGAAAMLYVSSSPNNLIQIGTVADPEDGFGPIPAVTVGADEGAALKAALAAGQTVSVQIEVKASIEPGIGRNVVGTLSGTDPDGAYIVVGAHYDTWYAGSVDNGTGVAAMIEVAETLADQPRGRLGIVFVGYDGEELGLFGGYDFLRKHVVVDQEDMVAFVNFEMPGNGEGLRGLGTTRDGPLTDLFDEARTKEHYPVILDLNVVSKLMGGGIPTDIQGMYWHGLQGVTTSCDTPYYHTTEDTPDKVDMDFFATAILHFGDLTTALTEMSADDFRSKDRNVWSIAPTTTTSGDDLIVDVQVTDSSGVPQSGANVRVWLDVDDFTRIHDLTVIADESGYASATIPASALKAGADGRWVHVTAGHEYPQAEAIVALP